MNVNSRSLKKVHFSVESLQKIMFHIPNSSYPKCISSILCLYFINICFLTLTMGKLLKKVGFLFLFSFLIICQLLILIPKTISEDLLYMKHVFLKCDKRLDAFPHKKTNLKSVSHFNILHIALHFSINVPYVNNCQSYQKTCPICVFFLNLYRELQ